MRFIRRLILTSVFSTLVAFTLTAAAETPAASITSYIPVYIDAASLPPTLLPAPANESSAIWKQEIKSILTLQRNISKNDQAAIIKEQAIDPKLLAAFVSPDLTQADYPKTFALLDNVFRDTSAVVRADKIYWHTKRPYLLNPHIKIFAQRLDDSPSYPSGHETESLVMAEVLGILYPEKREALLTYAEEIGLHRIEAGLHYPEDINGGRRLAMLVLGALTQNEDFADDLAAAKAEIASR